jgi:hypothetical protein
MPPLLHRRRASIARRNRGVRQFSAVEQPQREPPTIAGLHPIQFRRSDPSTRPMTMQERRASTFARTPLLHRCDRDDAQPPRTNR